MIRRNKKTFKSHNPNAKGNVAQNLAVEPKLTQLSEVLQINEITSDRYGESITMEEAEKFLKKYANAKPGKIDENVRDLHAIINPKLTIHNLDAPKPIHFADALNQALGTQFSVDNEQIVNYNIKLPSHNRNEYNALISTIKDYQVDPAMRDSTLLIKFYDALVAVSESESKSPEFKFEAKDTNEIMLIKNLFKGHKYPIRSVECHMINEIVMVLNALIEQ